MPKARLLFCLLLSGCASHSYVGPGVQTQFSYDLWLPAHTRDELWNGARDYFTSAYRGDQMALDALNPDSGNITGIGAMPWHLPNGEECRVGYRLDFTASDDRSKLRFTPDLDAISGGEDCDGWRRISPAGYGEMQAAFTRAATALQEQIGGPAKAAPENTLRGNSHQPVTIKPSAARAQTTP